MSTTGVDPTRIALGTWSGGRFMHFGEPLDDERYKALITPGRDIPTVLTADVYATGQADEWLGYALKDLFADPDGLSREQICVAGTIGHDFYTGERNGPKGYPRFTNPGLRSADQYGSYLRMAAEKSLERVGIDSFDLLMLHNPDQTGYTNQTVWDGMQALKDAGLARMIGVAPGPANGFALDLIDCFERYGDMIDWAMIILNPLEPWPGQYCLDAAAAKDIKVIARVVDYGGIFFDELKPGHQLNGSDHRAFRPAGWIEQGLEKMEQMRPIAQRTGLTMIQLASQWTLAHPAVESVVPTLIQEAGADARPVEDKRAEIAATPVEQLLTEADIEQINRAGDNHGCMKLKGATPAHQGEELADNWTLNDRLEDVARRWQIDPEKDLVQL